MWQKALNNGLVGGLVSIALTLIGSLTGLADPFGTEFSTTSALFSLLGLIVMVFFIRRAIIQYREEDNGGQLSFGQGLSVGVLTALVMGVISAVYLYVQLTMIDPDALSVIQDQVDESFEDRNMSEEEMETAKAWAGIFTSPAFMAVSSVFSTAFMGLIISLVVSAFEKRDVA